MNRISWIILTLFIFLSLNSEMLAKQAEYYFDGFNGSDKNPGTKNRPWKSFSKLKALALKPGDAVLFARGSSFHGSVAIKDSGTKNSPILFTHYGKGHLPKFTNSDIRDRNGNVFLIQGSYIILDGLYFHNGPSVLPGTSGIVRKTGAVFVSIGANHNIIRNCEVYDYPIGFHIYGQNCLVTRNYIHDCTGFLQFPSWGPIGIMVATSNNEISYNRIENYVVTGGTWGADGGAIEIDNSKIPKENIKIHHNHSVGNEGFLELINPCDVSNVHVHHNISDDYQQFIAWDTTTTPSNFMVEHNTVIRTHKENACPLFTVFYYREKGPDPDASWLTFRNNIFYTTWQPALDPFNYPHDHNLFYTPGESATSDPVGYPLGPGDIIADPQFVDLAARDLHLQSTSSAIDMGTDLGYTSDYVGNPVPIGPAPDAGAFEYQSYDGGS